MEGDVQAEFGAGGPQLPVSKLPPIDERWRRLSEKDEVWIDTDRKQVILGGRICLTEGLLEMFACPSGTKEHESVVAVNSSSALAHAGLLAVGAVPGSPVKYDPEYVPASGPVVDITVVWLEGDRQRQIAAQQMVRETNTKKVMTHHWVFGGSQEWKDEDTGDVYYMGDAGELICVSNFSTATIDLPVQSTDSNQGLLFEACPENIPPLNTRVLLILKPRRADSPLDGAAANATGKPESAQPSTAELDER